MGLSLIEFHGETIGGNNMNKRVLVLTLVMIMVFSLGVSASGLFLTASEKIENMATSRFMPNIVNRPGHSEFKYDADGLFSFYDGESHTDSALHRFSAQYGLYEDSEIFGEYFYNKALDTNSIILDFKHRFINENGWVVSGKVGYRNSSNSSLPFLSVLTDKSINPNLVLHNNLVLAFDIDNKRITKQVQNGLTYNIDDEKTVRAMIVSDTPDNLDNLTHTITAGIEYPINERIAYAGYIESVIDKDFAIDNVEISNEIAYEAMPDLRLTGNFELNTSDSVSNTLYAKAEKDFSNGIIVSGDYLIEIDSKSGRFGAKVQKVLDNDMSVYGQYYRDTDKSNWLSAGMSYEF